MKNLDIKNYQIVLFILLLLVGILFLALFSTPARYIGAILITIDVFYSGSILYSSLSNPDEKRLKSRTRDQIFRYQHKK